jgi:hypothetical protein
MYEENADDYVQKSMGIATKRRDYAPIVKTIYGGAIKILLANKGANPVPEAVAFVKKWVDDMMNNKVSLNQYMLTKSLRSEYKAATPPAHKQLADRITARDPGNAPASGDRLSFIYFKQAPGFKGSQGDRVETPAYIKASGLKPDPEYYIEHQIENPVGQLFSIMVDQLPNAKPPVKGWSSDPDIQTAEREIYAKEYLFRPAKQASTNTLMKMWGLPPAPPAAAQSITTRSRARVAATRADSLFMDRFLVDSIRKERTKSKKDKK